MQQTLPGIINPNEAPDGFYAVLKSSIPRPAPNLCTFCDWRPECQKPTTDFTRSNHRCMASPVYVHKDGSEVCRQDRCSVIFKRKASAP